MFNCIIVKNEKVAHILHRIFYNILHLSPLLPCTQSSAHLHLCPPDQEEAAGCGRLPGGSQGGLHPAGHCLQRGEPHVDEGQRSRGHEAQQWHPAAAPDLQRGQLLWRKERRSTSRAPDPR